MLEIFIEALGKTLNLIEVIAGIVFYILLAGFIAGLSLYIAFFIGITFIL